MKHSKVSLPGVLGHQPHFRPGPAGLCWPGCAGKDSQFQHQTSSKASAAPGKNSCCFPRWQRELERGVRWTLFGFWLKVGGVKFVLFILSTEPFLWSCHCPCPAQGDQTGAAGAESDTRVAQTPNKGDESTRVLLPPAPSMVCCLM